MTTASANMATLQSLLPERRVSFWDIGWHSYQQILEALGDNRSAQLIYYRGILEIMTPLEGRDNASELIGDFVKPLVDESDSTSRAWDQHRSIDRLS